MDDIIEVPVTYKNKNLIFSAHFLKVGFSYKFEVDINGINVCFEPDEEQNFRAFVQPEIINNINNIQVELLGLIAENLKRILK
jgi:hypothetical protein